ncbi:MAG: C-terminal binding protein [Actinobacteria bacterium]|nr:C-terminal binding protein [Actinomycetota bacterium]
MARKVLVTDHVFAGLAIERAKLEPLGAEVVLSASIAEQALIEQAAGADALMVCFARLTAPILEAAAGNGCRIVSRYGIGIDNIDVERATALGMQVTNVPDYCLDEVADHALATMLALAREVVTGANVVRAGGWEIPHGTVHRIRGRRLALLGVGRIGRRVVERALPFGLEVVGYDPFLTEDVPGMTRVESSADAVREADFVSLHAPLTEATRHLVGSELIDAMGRAPIVVNTSRGPLVDAEAALAGLESGKLGGVVLDVTEPEPLPDGHPLRTHPRAIVTPHMAFYSVEAEAELQARAAEEVARSFNGEPPRSPVNRPASA